MANKQYVKQSRLQIRTLSHRFFGLFRKKIQAFVRLMFRYKCRAVGTEGVDRPPCPAGFDDPAHMQQNQRVLIGSYIQQLTISMFSKQEQS